MSSLDRVAVIGTGAVGSAFAEALELRGRAAARVSRAMPAPQRARALEGCTLLLVCVPDRALAEAVAGLARELRAGAPAPVALHTSGCHGVEPLAPLAALGCAAGALHPALSFPPGERSGAEALAGAAFAFGGEPLARRAAEELARLLGGRLVELGVDGAARARYHAACALLSNGLVALFDAACAELAGAGFREPEGALELLRSLLASTAANLGARRIPPGRALSGPAARGDAAVVAAHLRVLEDPDTREVYRRLTRRMIALAEARGTLAPGLAREVEAALDGA